MRHLWTVLACIVVGLVADQQAPPVFRAATQFVAVDVVATGKGDALVTNLTKDDFEISENGKPQKISDFAFVSIPLATRVVDVDAPPQPPGDVASNATSARASRALVILVDDSSLSAALLDPKNPSNVLVDIKKALTTFLETLSSDDQVAIIWQSRSDASQDFTNDIPRLISAVNNRRTAMGLTALGPAWRPRVESLKFAVSALAGSHYARRAIVFVGITACNAADTGAGFEAQECQDLTKRARQAGVPIYTLDPRVNPPSGSHTMAELAINTGGRAFTQQSDPSAAVRHIMEENGSFYTLGFYPEPLVTDGKYHDIQVTVRRPGVTVRSRDRYLADTATRPASTPNRDMTAALGAGLDDPSLPIRMFVTPLAPGPGGTRTLVTVELAYPKPDGDIRSFDDELRLGILALTPDAKVKASLQWPVSFKGVWKSTAHGTLMMNNIIDLPAEQLTVRVGVTSKALGKTGTTHLTVDIPNYGDNGLQISPLLIGTSSTAANTDAAVGLDAIRPLVPFQPTTARVFARSDTLRVYARAYWRAGDTTADATVTITGAGSPTVRHLTLPAEATQGRRKAILDVPLPLAGLAPGVYVLHVETRLAKGKPAIRESPFEVR